MNPVDVSKSATVVRAALGFGSNLGDRRNHIAQAAATVAASPGVTLVATSPLFGTAPMGGPEQPDYVNAVAVIDTTLSARELLELAQRCERDAGRTRGVRWGPRTLDVDVLAFDAVVSDDPELTLPHPRATERAFVMVPWAAVDPSFVVSGRSVAYWAEQLGHAGVTPLSEGRA